MSLEIIIIGAGVAGLAAARAIAPSGHTIRIYERATSYLKEGSLVELMTPAVKILSGWGMTEALRPVELDTLWVRGYDDLSQLGDFDLKAIRKELDISQPAWTVDRSDMHRALRQQLKEWSNISIFLGVSMIDGDLEKGRVRLSNGAIDNADVIIGSDGVHSGVYDMFPTPNIPGHISRCRRSPLRINSCTLPTATALGDPVVRGFLESLPYKRGAGSYTATPNAADPKLGMAFLVAHSAQTISMSFIRGYPDAADETGPYTAPVSRDQFLTDMRYDLWADPIQRMIQLAGQYERWHVGIRDSPLSFNHKRGVLIGDAAHGVNPGIADGAGLGIEDGVCLGVLLATATRQNVAHRLALFNQIRYKKCVVLKYAFESRPVGTGTSAEMLDHLIPGATSPQRHSMEMFRNSWTDDSVERARAALGWGEEKAASEWDVNEKAEAEPSVWQQVLRCICL